MADIGVHTGKSRKWEEAITSLMSFPTIQLAADNAGISSRTMHRLLVNPEFQQQYRASKRETLDAAISKLQQAAFNAVEVLVEVANQQDTNSSSRVSAARAIIETALKASAIEDIERRLAELEGDSSA